MVQLYLRTSDIFSFHNLKVYLSVMDFFIKHFICFYIFGLTIGPGSPMSPGVPCAPVGP